MDERSTTASHRKNPYLRVSAALAVACLAAVLLPNNRDGVIREQLIQNVPKLAKPLGDGVWALEDGVDAAIVDGFASAVGRRPPGPRTGNPIHFSAQETLTGIQLVATRKSVTDTLQQRDAHIPIVNGWSLFPPLAAILIAIVSGRLVLGLSLAILGGAVLTVAPGMSALLVPVEAIRIALVDFVWTPLESSFQLYILGFTAALIGMMRVTNIAGGNRGIADLLARSAQGARSTRRAAFLMGLAIFFDDYANTVVVGTTLRPIADRFRVSREKLAFIVDSTAAPIAGVSIISTWIGYEVSLFEDLMTDLGTGLSGYELFFQALPLRFYCLMTLGFVAWNTFLSRDFGPMLRAEQRAGRTGQVLRPGAVPMAGRNLHEAEPPAGISPVWWAAAVPVVVVIGSVLAGIVLDTWQNADTFAVRETSGVLSLQFWMSCFSNADGARILFTASVVGSLVAIVIAVTRRNVRTGERPIGVTDALKTWGLGIVGVHYAIVILILAWAIKEVCGAVGTSTYLTAALSPVVSPAILPLLIFLLSSVVAFSIGTSWTTMALLIPTVVPLAHSLGGLPLTVIAAAAVLDGSIFGDHCSPISDTTVMSSIASSCDHLDHVRTQIPYALTIFAHAALFGYLGAVHLYPAWVGLALGIGMIGLILSLFGTDPDKA